MFPKSKTSVPGRVAIAINAFGTFLPVVLYACAAVLGSPFGDQPPHIRETTAHWAIFCAFVWSFWHAAFLARDYLRGQLDFPELDAVTRKRAETAMKTILPLGATLAWLLAPYWENAPWFVLLCVLALVHFAQFGIAWAHGTTLKREIAALISLVPLVALSCLLFLIAFLETGWMLNAAEAAKDW